MLDARGSNTTEEEEKKGFRGNMVFPYFTVSRSSIHLLRRGGGNVIVNWEAQEGRKRR